MFLQRTDDRKYTKDDIECSDSLSLFTSVNTDVTCDGWGKMTQSACRLFLYRASHCSTRSAGLDLSHKNKSEEARPKRGKWNGH